MKLFIHTKLQQCSRWRLEWMRISIPHFTGRLTTYPCCEKFIHVGKMGNGARHQMAFIIANGVSGKGWLQCFHKLLVTWSTSLCRVMLHVILLTMLYFLPFYIKIYLWHNSSVHHRMQLFRIPCHGPLARYVKLRVAHAPGMPGTFFLAITG